MLPDLAAGPAPLASADDDGGWSWLVTFSDLVLQLFGFVLVAAVVGGSALPAGVRDASVESRGASDEGAPSVVARHAERAPATAVESAPAGDGVAPTDVPDDASEALVPMRRDARDALPDAVVVASPHDVVPRGVGAAAGALGAGRLPGASAADDAYVPAVARSAPPDPAARRTGALAGYVEHLVALQPELGARVARDGDTVLVTIGDVAGFASGSAEPSRLLAPLLAELRALLRATADFHAEVAGHTDEVPIRSPLYRSNLELSLARAARVAHELAGDDAAVRARVSASGHGAERPIASNANGAGRARNRRVEIRLAVRA